MHFVLFSLNFDKSIYSKLFICQQVFIFKQYIVTKSVLQCFDGPGQKQVLFSVAMKTVVANESTVGFDAPVLNHGFCGEKRPTFCDNSLESSSPYPDEDALSRLCFPLKLVNLLTSSLPHLTGFSGLVFNRFS